MCPTEVPTPLPARSPEPWVSHVATPDEFELVALGSHLPGCGMALRRDHLEQGRTQEPPEHGGRCTRLRRARCPPPPSPAGPPWPPSRRWGAPLCLHSCSPRDCECSRIPDSGGGMGSSRMSHSLLPVSQLFEALRVFRQAGSHPQSLTNYFILLQMANCVEGQSRSHTLQWLPGCFGEIHTGDRLGLPLCGELVRRGPRGCGTGPRIIQTRFISVFLLFSNRCPNK